MRFPPSVLLLLTLALPLPGAESPAFRPSTPPRLGVLIVVDQMRGDYLARFGPYFGPGGFNRLRNSGVYFSNAHYRHAITHTSVGHATLASGVHANVHGVISNEWHDLASRAPMNCVEDPESPLVGIAPQELGPVAARNPAKTGRSPRNFMAETVGDALKRRFGDAAKIVSIANKDRSAILMGGRRADAAYWDENGRMVTSRYYRAALPEWVTRFNAEQRTHAVFGATWDRLLEPAIYERVQGPDDQIGENEELGLGRTFPKRIDGGAPSVGPKFFTAYDNSPFASEHLIAFVQRAVREEQLGRDDVPDLLCIGFSQIDAIGHNYGPDSHEVMDAMLRLDREIAGLLAFLDQEVGLERCVIALSADHGAAPLPERAKVNDPATPAGRLNAGEMDRAVASALDAAFGALPDGESWLTRDVMSYHLRPTALAARKVTARDAAAVMKTALLKFDGVADAFTRDELLADAPADDDTALLAMARRSYYAERGRDVLFVLRPNFILRSGFGTTHGTPHAYDTHVPLLISWPGVAYAELPQRVGVDQLAPTLAALLGVEAPNGTRALSF